MSGPRFLYNFTTPRLGVELPTGNLLSFNFKKRRGLFITALPPLGGCCLGVRIEYHHMPSSLLGYDSKTCGQGCLPTSAFLRY